jgi:hypothetical protein
MAKNKTAETSQSVAAFINQITDEAKRIDSFNFTEIMQQETGFEPKMWGANIVGFGSYHYKYASGHEGDAPLAAFSPRAKEFSLYLSQYFDQRQELLKEFGKHRAAVGCVYIKKLSDIDETVLRTMIKASVNYLEEKYLNNK